MAGPGPTRRTLLGYVLAAPILSVAVDWGLETATPAAADAAIPSLPGVADLFDLSDDQTAAAMPTYDTCRNGSRVSGSDKCTSITGTLMALIASSSAIEVWV